VERKMIRAENAEKESVEAIVTTDGIDHTEILRKVSPFCGLKWFYKKTILLEKISIGRKCSVDNIYFAPQKAIILKESYDILNKVADILKKDAQLNIEIREHTDAPLSGLSKRRADAVLNYPAKKGINRKRMTSKGMSNTEPIDGSAKKTGVLNSSSATDDLFKKRIDILKRKISPALMEKDGALC
jgi:hypothetical protein